MSLIDNSASLSIGPLLVLTTVPVGAGELGRGPLGPLVAGKPPTRNGSLRIDRARPSTTVVQLATTRIVPRQAIAARAVAITRRESRRFRAWLVIYSTPSRPASKESHLRGVGFGSVPKRRCGAVDWGAPRPTASARACFARSGRIDTPANIARAVRDESEVTARRGAQSPGHTSDHHTGL